MATPTPDDQTNVTARSANDDCKCFVKIRGHEDICAPDDTDCIKGGTFEYIQCVTDEKQCEKAAEDVKDSAGKTSAVKYPPEADEYTMTLQARAGATANPWGEC